MYPGGMDLMTASFPTTKSTFSSCVASHSLTFLYLNLNSWSQSIWKSLKILRLSMDFKWRQGQMEAVILQCTWYKFWALASKDCSLDFDFDETSSASNEISHNFWSLTVLISLAVLWRSGCQSTRTDFSVVPLSFFSVAAKRIDRFVIWWKIHLLELKYLQICSLMSSLYLLSLDKPFSSTCKLWYILQTRYWAYLFC